MPTISGVAAPHAASHACDGGDAIPLTMDDGVYDDSDVVKSTAATSYAKIKETRIKAVFGGSIRVGITNHRSNAAHGWYRIYIDGGAVGTEIYVPTGTDEYMPEVKEDITIADGDRLIQVYAKSSNGTVSCHSKNLIIYGSYGIVIARQDP